MSESEKNPTRRHVTAGLGAAAVASSLPGLLSSGTAAAATSASAGTAAADGAPVVVPALREWKGAEGQFKLTGNSRFLVPRGNARLLRLARSVTDEIAELTGIRPAAPRVADGDPGEGEIQLRIDEGDSHPEGGERYRAEGSRIAVTARDVRLTAPAYAGVFYATRSLLQILVGDRNRVVPAGTAADWPSYAQRGFLLDVGRRFFTPGFIRDYIRALSWFKYNTLQLHLNDNEIEAPGGDWSKAYAAFRLAGESGPWKDLTAKDGSYDRSTWDGFEDLAEAHAVCIVPEFDAPAHSRAFVVHRPDIGLDGGNSDHLDLSKPAATAYMKDLFSEFMPWFRSPVVHYGADEYSGPVEHYRAYFNALASHVRSLGKEPAAWGSLTELGGGAEGCDREVLMYSWNNGWYAPKAAKSDGYELVNINDSLLYIVPFADYYHGDGLDGQYLYDSWAPHVSPDGQSLEAGDPALRGAMFGVWNDLVHEKYTELDVHGMVNKTLGVLGQKMWSGKQAAGLGYDAFQKNVAALGLGAGLEVVGR